MQPSAVSTTRQTPRTWKPSAPGELLPGVTLAAAVALVALNLGGWLATTLPGVPVSAIMIAILCGMLVSNTAPLHEAFQPGLTFCLARILQVGIVLLGIRLSLADVAVMGLTSIPLIVACIATAIFTVRWLGRRAGLSPELATLIAVGTSICGATAIVTTAPIIKARTLEVGYAVACITLFGMVAVLLYPLAAHWLFAGDASRVGLFLGTAIHDTAQVVGAGMVYQNLYGAEQALDTAAVTKLMRNLSMLIVIPMLCMLFQRSAVDASERPHWGRLVPLFIVGFGLMSLVRTLGDLAAAPGGWLPADQWHGAVGLMQQGAEFCLLIAMAAVGLNTRLAGIKSAGLRPLGIGLAAAMIVGGLSLTLILMFY